MNFRAGTRGSLPPLFLAVAIAVQAPRMALGQAPEVEPVDCLIEPNVVIELGSPVEGILAEVTVDRGDQVEAGQIVARLDSTVEEATVALARARVDRTPIEAGQERLDARARDLLRTRELHAKGNAPTKTLNEMETEAKLAELELREAKIALEVARLELKRTESLLEQRRLYSPIDGVVLLRNLAPGEHVHEQSVVLEIASLDPLHVEVFAPKSWLGRIAKGMTARVIPEQPIGGIHTAEVVVVDPVVDAASGTFGLRLELANPDRRVPPGIKCQVTFAGP